MLGLFVGLASAQVAGVGSGGGNLVCTANVSNPTQVRSEGYTELLGDIVIACTGGTILAPGTAVPTANITVAIGGTLVTSRQLGNGLSEALLLIDEPNAPAGSGAGFPLTVCSSVATNFLVGAGAGGCPLVASTVPAPPGSPVLTATPPSATVYAAATSGGTVVNVFQGIVPAGTNLVVFNGVPILAPGTTGFARVFRITNIRANVNGLGGGSGFQGTSGILANVTISNGLLISSPSLTVANIFTGLSTTTTGVRNGANSAGGSSIITGGIIGPLAQCNSVGLSTASAAAVLRFGEGFASAFKTRVAPTLTYTGSGAPSNSVVASAAFTQNTPGFLYAGSESGFILQTLSGTAGIADFGTRLKATFSNIPTGVQLYVTTTNILAAGGAATSGTTSTTGIPVNASSALVAGLVISETANSSFGAIGPFGGVLPLQGGTTTVGGTSVFPIQADANGTATAVWEILETNPASQEVAEFGVFYAETGNQNAGTPQQSPAATVNLSFAPTATTLGGGTTIPRFSPSTNSTTFINVALCQTEILFPFVNTVAGYDTGISIANTTADPQGSVLQTGPCTLNFYGSGAGTTTTAAFPSTGVTPFCPSGLTVAAGSIGPGCINAEQISNIKNGFEGYVIAVCNFQLAHGLALFSDTGIRNWATSYLGLTLPTVKRTAPSNFIGESLSH